MKIKVINNKLYLFLTYYFLSDIIRNQISKRAGETYSSGRVALLL